MSHDAVMVSAGCDYSLAALLVIVQLFIQMCTKSTFHAQLCPRQLCALSLSWSTKVSGGSGSDTLQASALLLRQQRSVVIFSEAKDGIVCIDCAAGGSVSTCLWIMLTCLFL